MTKASTWPSVACRNAFGSVPTISKPSFFHKSTAGGVGADNEVELHRLVAGPARFVETMLAHHPAGAFALRGGIDHERRVGHVRAEADVVGNQLVHADDAAIVFEQRTTRMPGPRKYATASAPGRVGSERVGVAAGDHGLKDAPDRVRVGAASPDESSLWLRLLAGGHRELAETGRRWRGRRCATSLRRIR